VNVRTVARFGGQAVAVTAAVKSLRQARAEGDTLKLLDALVHALAIATAIALIVREVRQERSLKAALDVED
jgi:flagellar biogenesis protein FliO